MKTLQQHINEKLVINKGLKGCNYKKQNKKDILNAYFNLVEIIEEHSNMNIMVSLGYGTYDNDTPHMQAKFENEDLYEEGLPTIHNKYEYMLLEQGWDYLMELFKKKSIAYEFECRDVIEHMLDYIKKHADFDVKELEKRRSR